MKNLLDPNDYSSSAVDTPFLLQLLEKDVLKTTALFALALQTQQPCILE